MTQRVAVVGGGIIGTTVARAILRRDPGVAVTVFEKEPAVAAHQTGHNSGVVHAGLYYEPGSLKARLCRRGGLLLREFCREKDLPYEECGKVVVAQDAAESVRLEGIAKRAVANGVEGVRMLDAAELRRREPHVRGIQALLSPVTAITDFTAVTRAVARDVEESGGEVRLSTEVRGMTRRGAEVVVRTSDDEEAFDFVIGCAGLQSDRVAEMAGDGPEPKIIPFRGDYYALVPERRDLVNGLVYPVPDPRYPFLGVHATPRVDGEVLLGPNAFLALSREGYRWGDVSAGDLLDVLRYRGFRRFARRHWRTGVAELRRSTSRRAFVAQARLLLPDVRPADVVRVASGVRAQALEPTGEMVDDFRLVRTDRTMSVRNAPSPAATSSMAIAEHILAELGTPW
ncbi:L-2-hydroxyglutarate oxidase [Microbacterium sp. X-17]|uniref:L-2-hydroxyglutarate oxidase n=1 Tax=Microbacterium sp. X-17 TaxID=3144404 RepID=UPI0031F5AF66